MNPDTHLSAKRRTLAVTLVAGSWLGLSMLALGADGNLPAGITVAPEPARIHVAQAAAAPVDHPVSYASEQADRGQTNFTKFCVECHGEDLKGGLLGGAPLRGVSFEEKFVTDMPAGMLFEVMSATMPPDAPGRFSPSAYADLMAYILKRNGFQSGAPLPSDVDALYALTMEK